MSEELTNFFVLFGILFSFVIVGFILIVMFDFIKQKNDELKNYHRIKHRFDKPPLADCYCIDCKYYLGYACLQPKFCPNCGQAIDWGVKE